MANPTTYDIEVVGVARVIAHLAKLQSGLQEPTKGLENATNYVAKVFRQNYDSEGGLVGGWEDLAEKTQSIRSWQGFEPEHPIMVRYDSLRHIAVTFFETAKAGYRASSTDGYSDQTVEGSLTISGSRATLSIGGGYKILNQFGYPDTNGSGDNPARPYWFINAQVVDEAQHGVVDWIKDEVLSWS